MGRIDAETETLIPVGGGFDLPAVAPDDFLPLAHALRADGFDASEDGTGRGTPLVPCAFDARQSDVITYGNQAGPFDTDGHSIAIAFSSKDHGADAGDIAPTLRAGGHTSSHANGGVMPAVAVREPFTLAIRGRGDSHDLEYRQDGTANALLTPNGGRGGIGVGAVAAAMAVRRLTPRECERLQGFPDDYTLIPYRGKLAADGPRYKALGNSMAVPVMAWIGRRMQMVDEIA